MRPQEWGGQGFGQATVPDGWPTTEDASNVTFPGIRFNTDTVITYASQSVNTNWYVTNIDSRTE